MGAEAIAQIGQGAAGAGQGVQSITGALGDIFGSSQEIKGTGTTTEQLQISDAGVAKILKDILGSAQGLASLFNEENISGLYNTSVAKQASGNLLANLAGEIAKLTAKKVTTKTEEQESEDPGLLGQVGLDGVAGGKGFGLNTIVDTNSAIIGGAKKIGKKLF